MMPERSLKAGVSFGSVATLEFDSRSDNSVETTLSVDDFERYRLYHDQPRRKKKRNNGPVMYRNQVIDSHRVQFLQQLQHQIEQMISTNDSIIKRREADGQDAVAPQNLTPSEAKEIAKAPLSLVDWRAPRRPRTRSWTRLSQLHLSKLNLASNFTSLTTASPSNTPQMDACDMKNAVFATPRKAADEAPRRPSRKRSSECMREVRPVCEEFGPTTDLNTQNATWKTSKIPTRKRSDECISQKMA